MLTIQQPAGRRREPESIVNAMSENPDQPKRLKVLVAEDEPVSSVMLGDMLELCGHEPAFARDGLEAVEAFKNGDFDLVLMDIRMPHLHGIEATRQIRALGEKSAMVPVIAITCEPEAFKLVTRDRHDMDGYIGKPYDLDTLKYVIDVTLTETGAPELVWK